MLAWYNAGPEGLGIWGSTITWGTVWGPLSDGVLDLALHVKLHNCVTSAETGSPGFQGTWIAAGA